MKPFVELNREGQALRWQTHLLSDVMLALGLDKLAAEPVLCPEAELAAARFEAEGAGGRGIRWAWGGWSRVEVRLCEADGGQPPITRRRGESSLLEWLLLPFCDAVELTPFDAGGAAGPTVRIERPVTVAGEEIDFHADFDKVVVRLRNYNRSADVYAELRTLTMNQELKPKGGARTFALGNRVELRVPEEWLLGYVVVVRRRRRRKYLLDYRPYRVGASGVLPRQHDDRERSMVRREIEGPPAARSPQTDVRGGDWLARWPERSRERLTYLQGAAAEQSLADAAEFTPLMTPTGLFRAIVLTHCGFAWPLPAAQAVAELDGGTFEQALARMFPELPAVLAMLNSPDAKRWALAHANEPRLDEVVRWVGHQGVDALERALLLVELRAEVARLGERLRAESPESRAVADLLADIERATRHGASPGDLRARLEAVRRRVAEADAAPVDPEGREPALKEHHAEWLARRERMSRWRRLLAQVVDHCETGQWILPQSEPDPAGLERRLRAIESPVARPLRNRDTPRGEDVRLSVKGLLDDLAHEARASLRGAADACLRQVVLPHAALWLLLHEEIARAESAAAEFRWLAEGVGFVTRGRLDERVRSAQNLLLLVEAAEEFARGWDVESEELRRLSRDRPALVKILLTPNHRWVEDARQRCRELYDYLSPTELAGAVSPPGQWPSPPPSVSRQTLQGWWEVLRELDISLNKLEWGMRRFSSLADYFRRDKLPELERLVEDCKRRPAGQGTASASRIIALYEKGFAGGGEPLPRDLMELLKLLEEHGREGRRGRPEAGGKSPREEVHE
jgi:hypothetical protein